MKPSDTTGTTRHMTARFGLQDVPDKLSKLIRLAISDARRLDPAIYEPDHGVWHTPLPAACFVCDAGAVIAGTLIPSTEKHSPNCFLAPNCFPEPWARALRAIDAARSGSIHEALAYLVIAHDPAAAFDPAPHRAVDNAIFHALGDNECCEYTDWDTFKAHLSYMDRVADQLEHFGL